MRTMSADEAAAHLGVRKETLYTYVSRGWLRAVREGRRSRYPVEDVEALHLRAAAAGGHEAAAADAMDWGAPILASSITSIDVDGPNYRGVPALTLAEEDVPFEEVAELLWTGERRPGRWEGEGAPLSAWADLIPPGTPVGPALLVVVSTLGLADPLRWATGAEHARFRGLIRHLAGALALLHGEDREARMRRALRQETVAAVVREALGCAPEADRWIGRALVLCADHELNASTFAARVAAGTGADAYACVAAALAAWSGPRHGGATDRVAHVSAQLGAVEEVRPWVAERFRLGEPIAGFGHRLYPGGDPRAARLLEDAAEVDAEAVAPLLALVEEVARAGGEAPTLDVGIAALARALRLPRHAGSGLFAVGRAAGWLAHVEEQRASGRMLRPRAVYQGP